MSRLQSFSIDVASQGYRCENCNLYNDILTVHCRDCNGHRSSKLDLAAIQVRHIRGIDSAIEWTKIMGTSRLDKYNQYYNSHKPLYSAMTFEQRMAWKEEMADVCVNSRAGLAVADDIDREEGGKLSLEGRQWLVSNDERTGSDALNQPKIRKERMSKLDKLAADMMEFTSLSKEDINKYLGAVQKVQTGGSIVSSHTREMKDNVVFVREPKPSVNTQESLLADIGDSLVSGINERPIDDLVDAAKTAGHIANKILGKEVETIQEVEQEKPNSTVFDVSQLKFGA